MTRVYVATTDGVIVLEEQDGQWNERGRSLQGQEVTSIIAREDVILAGTTRGIYRSDDGGGEWTQASEGFTHPHVRWLAYHPDISDLEFAGTEPAAIFVSRDGAATWQECGEVALLREQLGWYLPYSPEAGCVRSFAFHSSRGYAAVEVGGVLTSLDMGNSWQLVPGSSGVPSLAPPSAGHIAADVHEVAVHPSSQTLVYAATHHGLYRSRDGGTVWQHVYDGCYTRALWLDPHDPRHIIFGPASERGWHGRIEESMDEGVTWSSAGSGLSLPWESGILVERFVQLGDWLFAVISDGQLYVARLPALHWRPLMDPDIGANALTMMH